MPLAMAKFLSVVASFTTTETEKLSLHVHSVCVYTCDATAVARSITDTEVFTNTEKLGLPENQLFFIITERNSAWVPSITLFFTIHVPWRTT